MEKWYDVLKKVLRLHFSDDFKRNLKMDSKQNKKEDPVNSYYVYISEETEDRNQMRF